MKKICFERFMRTYDERRAMPDNACPKNQKCDCPLLPVKEKRHEESKTNS